MFIGILKRFTILYKYVPNVYNFIFLRSYYIHSVTFIILFSCDLINIIQ